MRNCSTCGVPLNTGEDHLCENCMLRFEHIECVTYIGEKREKSPEDDLVYILAYVYGKYEHHYDRYKLEC